MLVAEQSLKCGQCKKPIGWLSRVIKDTDHDISIAATCIDCLPKQLDNADTRNIDTTKPRKWLKSLSKN